MTAYVFMRKINLSTIIKHTNMLKINRAIYFLFASLLIITACKKSIPDPEFTTGDTPRIFQLGDNFRTSYIINEGDTASYDGLLFSPAGKVKITWTVNDSVASTDTVFHFAPKTGGEFKIVLTATYNGLSSIRTSTVL